MVGRLSCPAACGILVPVPGLEPVFSAFKGRFFITGQPGKSLKSLSSGVLASSLNKGSVLIDLGNMSVIGWVCLAGYQGCRQAKSMETAGRSSLLGGW